MCERKGGIGACSVGVRVAVRVGGVGRIWEIFSRNKIMDGEG